MKSTLAELLIVLSTITGEPFPEELPTLLIVPPVEMPCNCQAAYDNGRIYVRNDINWREPRWLSVVLHELEHHRQFVKSGPAQGCHEWLDRERQAIRVQTAYLEKTSTAWRPLLMVSCR
jgi:hypothetical protein